MTAPEAFSLRPSAPPRAGLERAPSLPPRRRVRGGGAHLIEIPRGLGRRLVPDRSRAGRLRPGLAPGRDFNPDRNPVKLVRSSRLNKVTTSATVSEDGGKGRAADAENRGAAPALYRAVGQSRCGTAGVNFEIPAVVVGQASPGAAEGRGAVRERRAPGRPLRRHQVRSSLAMAAAGRVWTSTSRRSSLACPPAPPRPRRAFSGGR